ncbi:MAG TPA: hypothetical protein PLG41_00110 [Leptospiraceae bacterium]|nr:hypothetical protein [Leptospiraceae bacterium]
MKSNFLIFTFLFSIFSLINAETQTEKKAFLLNVNGIFIYKTKDINQKVGNLIYQDEFFILENANDEEWTKIRKGKEFGFIRKPKSTSEEILLFDSPISKNYLVTRISKNQILEQPFSDSKSLDALEKFSVLEILSYSLPFEHKKENLEQRWFEVKAKNHRVGFVKDVALFYDSLEKAMTVVQKKQISLSGYALVSNPIYLTEPDGKVIETNKRGSSKKGEFIPVKESQERKGVKYFYTSMRNPSLSYKMQATPKGFQDKPFAGWISEKNVKYFTPGEFSQYTLRSSKYTGDKLLLEKIFAQNEDLPLNYLNVYLNPIGDKKEKEKSLFSITSLYIGYVNSSGYGEIEPQSFVVKKEKESYTVFAGNISNRGKFEFFDLDHDGIPEIFSSMETNSMSRVAFTAPAFYGYINGAYIEIPLPGNFLDNYTIDEKFLYLNVRETSNKKVDQKKYKYLQGKFVEVKN